MCLCACVRVWWICPRHNSKLYKGIKFIFGRYLKFILKLSKFNYIVDWIILSRLKNIKKNMEKSNSFFFFFFFCRRVCISVGCKRIFLKDLKLPLNSYFCRSDRVILSRLKKIKKNIEKSNSFFFLSPGLHIGRM